MNDLDTNILYNVKIVSKDTYIKWTSSDLIAIIESPTIAKQFKYTENDNSTVEFHEHKEDYV